MPLRWLHIAGLGFGGESIRAQRARQALPVLLQERRTAGEGVHVIFVAGDVAATGTTAAYAHTEAEPGSGGMDASGLLDALASSAAIGRDAIVVVPGDGDVDPGECIGTFALPNEEHAFRYFGRDRRLRDLDRLDPFLRWHDSFSPHPFPTKSTCDVVCCAAGGRQLAVLRINTALFATPDAPALGELWIGRPCLQRALDSLPARERALRVALLHHPLDWLHPDEQTAISKRLRSSVDILLLARRPTGLAAQTVSTGDGTVIELAAGEGRIHHHAFIATLEGTALTVEPLRYEDGPGRWTLDPSMFPRGAMGHFTVGPAALAPVASPTTTTAALAAAITPAAGGAGISAKEQAGYVELLREQYGRLSMVGLGADRLRLSLDDVYVPLQLQQTECWTHELGAGDARALAKAGPHGGLNGRGGVDLNEAFTLANGRQLFIVGEPGSGKTTALRKLLWQCVKPEREGGLSPQQPTTKLPRLPIFAHIRQLDGPALGRPFVHFLQRELERQASLSQWEVPPALAERLWERGHLLVLLDGLDEVADTSLRAQICRRIEQESHKAAGRDIRMAVSCRLSGIDGEADLSSDDFQRLEVQPLDATHSRDLVTKWFMAAEQALAEADKAAREAAGLRGLRCGRELADKLDSSSNRNKLRTILGNPLLLTQLCLVVFNGGEIPERRAAFFEECLKLLLGRWIGGRGSPPMLSTDHALQLLRPMAWTLQCAQRKYDLTVEEVRAAIREPLARLEGDLDKPLPLRALLRWFHGTTGVLNEYAAGEYGFSHLHFQEYLAAEHASHLGAAGIEMLAKGFGQDWWEEVVQLYVAVDDRGGFAQLMDQVLPTDALLSHQELLRHCIRLARRMDEAPFLILALNRDASPARREAALKLVMHRGTIAVKQAVAGILEELDDQRMAGTNAAMRASALRATAEQIEARPVPTREGEAAERLFDVFLSHNSRDKALVRDIYQQLGRRNIRAWLDEEELPPGQPWMSLLERAIESTKTAAVFFGSSGMGAWEDPEMRACLAEFVRRGMPVIPVLLPGGCSKEALPLFLRNHTPVDMRGGVDHRQLDMLVWGITRIKPASLGDEIASQVDGRDGQHMMVEPTTRMRFVWIAPGSFMMGSNFYKDEQPIHGVELSGFWLGEMPVTNQQYGVFLEATGVVEPEFWRNRQFNTPKQPVVGISWHDAKAFCAWLSETTGGEVVLPSEAQWEYAARGPDNWLYPWGNEAPCPERACYNKSSNGATALVGSFPQGRGPFGTHDQAGNVWEWCEDIWDETAYSQPGRAKRDPVRRPAVEGNGDGDARILRGGSWDFPAERLRAAVRIRCGPALRYGYIGFRVAVIPRTR